MDYTAIEALGAKLYFTAGAVAKLSGITVPSARVRCARYVKKGIFRRLKKNFYLLEQNWKHLSRDDFLVIANFLQVPSYSSLSTALSLYEVTTQVQRNVFENISVKRSVTFKTGGAVFRYYKIKKKYYSGFSKKGPFFIAAKEKAFVDAIYLHSFGKYSIDFDAIDLRKLDMKRVRRLLAGYPARTKRIARRVCGI